MLAHYTRTAGRIASRSFRAPHLRASAAVTADDCGVFIWAASAHQTRATDLRGEKSKTRRYPRDEGMIKAPSLLNNTECNWGALSLETSARALAWRICICRGRGAHTDTLIQTHTHTHAQKHLCLTALSWQLNVWFSSRSKCRIRLYTVCISLHMYSCLVKFPEALSCHNGPDPLYPPSFPPLLPVKPQPSPPRGLAANKVLR